MKSQIPLILIGILAVLPARVSGAVVFSQTPNGTGNIGDRSDFKGGGTNQCADNFSLASDDTIEKLRMWGSYNNDNVLPTDSFTVRFFNDSSGAPATNPFQEFTGVAVDWRVDSGLTDSSSKTVFYYGLTLPSSVDLTAGNTYYLSLVNDTTSNTAWKWYQTTNGASLDGRWNRSGDGSSWSFDSGNNLSFEVNAAAVPEPSSLLLISFVGAAGGLVVHWRRRRKLPTSVRP